MTDLHLRIGGLGVSLACSHEALAAALARRYADFATPGEPHCRVEVTLQVSEGDAPVLPGDALRWDAEGNLHFAASDYQGWISPAEGRARLHLAASNPVEGADYFLRVVYALLAFRAGGVLFHAAAVVRDGRAFLFFGPSGSGKTTVSALSSAYRVLNDDLVLLLPHGDAWYAYATPFWNPTQVRPSPGHAPVHVLLRLMQSPRLYAEPLRGATAQAEFLACLPVLPTNAAFVPALLSVGRALLQRVPMYRLYFPKDDTFWTLVDTLV